MGIAKPRYIVLDSSTLANLARHFFSPDSATAKKAKLFLDRLKEHFLIPLLCGENLVELAAHADQEVVSLRFQFLGGLREVASVQAPGHPRDCCLAVAATFVWEIDGVRVLGNQKAGELAAHVRAKMVFWSTGQDLIAPATACLQDFSAFAQLAIKRSIGVASIAHMPNPEKAQENLNGIFSGKAKLATKGEMDSSLREYRVFVEDQLRKVCDPRLLDLSGAAEWFTNQVAKGAAEKLEKLSQPADLHDAQGIPKGLIRPGATVDDVGSHAEFNRNLRIASDVLGFAIPMTEAQIPQDLCPSWIVRRELKKARKKNAKRASGGDLMDSFLASIVPYTDIIVVDKRTKEYLRQVARGIPKVGAIFGQVVTAADYSDIWKSLEERR